MYDLKDLYGWVAQYSPKLLIGIVIFLVSWAVAYVMSKLVQRLGSKLDVSRRNIARLGAGMCKGAILVVGLITGLGTMGVNVSALVAGLGLTGFALGFALKDALSNLLSGVLILVYQPFRNGDMISVTGCEGEVVEINLRYTVIRKESDKYLIPNSTIFTNTVRISDKT